MNVYLPDEGRRVVHMDRRHRSGAHAALLACVLLAIIAQLALLPVRALAASPSDNLALNKTAVADSQEADSVRAPNATDGDETSRTSRWGSARDASGGPHWIYVDLGAEKDVASVRVFWENRKATAYRIQYATGDAAPDAASNAWKDAFVSSDRPASTTDVINLQAAVKARYVRLHIDSFTATDPDGGVEWDTVSIYELEAFDHQTVAPQDPSANVARGMAAQADSVESGTQFTADKAFDGNSSARTSRWASANSDDPENTSHWIYVDLGQLRNVKTVRLYWEQRKPTGYKLQIASGETAPATDEGWTNVYTKDGHPESATDTIRLDEVKQARFVRLLITGSTNADPDGGAAWGTVSLYEMEVYGGEPVSRVDTVQGMLDAIEVETPKRGDTTLKVTIPSSEKIEAAYNGTDYEQVIGAQDESGNIPIYQPVVDTQVKVSFKATNKETGAYQFKEFTVTVPGAHQKADGDNPAPTVVPELREWKGTTGSFSMGSRVLYADDSLKSTAEALAADYADLFDGELAVAKGDAHSAATGDVVLTLTDDESLGLQDEGYLMEVTDKVVTTAHTQTGSYWSTRTILQALKSSGNGTIACGTARDYPLYKVRGLILDVGRKTFTMDWLRQMSRELSWYKMNDFQVHLSDNYIWVEEYTNETVDQAYSGFRLESDIKAGGNGGLNKADLTSTDVFYTKDEFRQFIADSRAMGVNVVPEFDMPAHSLALTKVRPDLRTPTSATHRGNDHLNLLGDKYRDSLAFALSIWDEYTTGDNPVFDGQTTIHIGADEFEANGNAYRTFVNDLFSYAESSGRTARVWGSLTHIKGSVAVSGTGANGQRRQMNIWSTGWADAKEMYNLGFGLIDSLDTKYYIVPNGGYYHSTGLDAGTVYNGAINTMGNVTIPAGDAQMLGGAFAVWNDMSGKRENGVSQYDVYRLIDQSAGLFASAAWGKGARDLGSAQDAVSAVGLVPQTNFDYETVANEDGVIAHWGLDDLTDASGNGNNLVEGANAKFVTVDGVKALSLQGGQSYASVGSDLKTVSLGSDLRVKVKRTSPDASDQVLFESDYGQIKAVQGSTGKVGITRENHDYSFDYELPVGTWVELEFKNEKNKVSLYVNGELVEQLGTDADTKLKATCMFPVERIGSKTSAFKGYVDNVRVTRAADFASTMKLDQSLVTASGILAEKDDAQLAELAARARAVVDSVNPSADEVSSLKEQLDARIAQLGYDRADYSHVDALLALIPANLDDYTPQSVAALTAARENVLRDLPKASQAAVDLYAKSLRAAIDGLEPRSSSELFAKLTSVTACSEELHGEAAPNGPAAAAIDGDEGSFWHSQWQGTADTTMPHWIDVALDEARTVDALVYVPRGGSANGRLLQYRVDVRTQDGGAPSAADDATEPGYVTVASGTLESSAGAKTIAFDAPVANATNVRLYFITTDGAGAQNKNKFVSAAEIRVRYVDTAIDIEGLAALVKQAEGLDEKAYEADGWKLLQEELASAKGLLASDAPTREGVNAAKASLRSAMLALVPTDKAPVEPVDPDTPGTPDTPDTPADPSDPGTPADPDTPGTPDTPGNPDTPGTPDAPDTPDTPDIPSGPDAPVDPSAPKGPEGQGSGDQGGAPGTNGTAPGKASPSGTTAAKRPLPNAGDPLPSAVAVILPVAAGALIAAGAVIRRRRSQA